MSKIQFSKIFKLLKTQYLKILGHLDILLRQLKYEEMN